MKLLIKSKKGFRITYSCTTFGGHDSCNTYK